jgi:hypothetical protein
MPRKLKGGRKLKMICEKCGGPYERCTDGKRRCVPCHAAARLAWGRANPDKIRKQRERHAARLHEPKERHPAPLDRNWRLPLPPEQAAARRKQRERDTRARRRSCAPTAEA